MTKTTASLLPSSKGKFFDLVVVGAGQYVEKVGVLPGHQGHPILTASRVHKKISFWKIHCFLRPLICNVYAVRKLCDFGFRRFYYKKRVPSLEMLILKGLYHEISLILFRWQTSAAVFHNFRGSPVQLQRFIFFFESKTCWRRFDKNY